MKYRKISVTAMILSVILIIGTVSVFGCAKWDKDEKISSDEQILEWMKEAIEQDEDMIEEAERKKELLTEIKETQEKVISEIKSLSRYNAERAVQITELEEQMMVAVLSKNEKESVLAALEADLKYSQANLHLKEVIYHYQSQLLEVENIKKSEEADLLTQKITELYKELEEMRNQNQLTEEQKSIIMIQLSEYEKKIEEYTEKIQVLQFFIQETQTDIDNLTEFNWPLPAEYDKFSPVFGYHIVTVESEMHMGIDIPAEYGTDVYASNSGTVVIAEYNYELGNYILIEHENGKSTLYAHLSEIDVEVGASVSKMDVIGKVGSTGYSTGDHLHFETWVDGIPVDPMLYISAE